MKYVARLHCCHAVVHCTAMAEFVRVATVMMLMLMLMVRAMVLATVAVTVTVA